MFYSSRIDALEDAGFMASRTPALARTNVLIVEEESLLQNLFQGLYDEHGVWLASSVEEAREILEKNSLDIHLVLSGTKIAANRIEDRIFTLTVVRGRIPILWMVQDENEGARLEEPCLQKPFSHEQLRKKIRSIMETRSPQLTIGQEFRRKNGPSNRNGFHQ